MVFKLRTGTILMVSLIALGILPCPDMANALFKVNEAPVKQPILASLTTPSSLSVIIESGHGVSTSLSSKGNSLPVNIALGAIIPDDWKIGKRSHKGLLSRKVTWVSSEEPWKTTLESMGHRNKIRFFINWDRNEVTVLPLKPVTATQKTAPQKRSVSTKPAEFPQKEQELKPRTVAANTTPKIKSETPPPDVSQASYEEKKVQIKSLVWELKSGSLRKQVEAWCKFNKWTLVWNSVLSDYILATSAQFTGEFEQTVHEAFLVLRKTADCGITPKFHNGNNVVEIKDI